MRYVPGISALPVTEIGGRKVKAVSRVSAPTPPQAHEQPVEAVPPRTVPASEERRVAQRRITNQPVLMDRRSGLERRRYNLFRHIDEEA
ncbi:MAG: hypothetical protein GC139_02040 [Sideroxydans sp.]|nr:hypothetical protein [Sideroxydans sp.]